ncbi:cys/Met metabolism PLP-dependent enzyme domain-containing protein [Trichoderma breve]|uniref:Cys/Met metabolism PLP-dependent enzyme domain-containing protein n=1 Tax=Trichoderma breve TaxID=2034170 RepID=A0A9W9EBV0_9HYPO|nr:cys/Met metabolism PLP-dependent enzyme domain-containing protein [Trichoderma breve]KAJ4863840.1 cys/Met metabolism PLP-dependent enzyme domain-containing protein [Trichoderma breve]
MDLNRIKQLSGDYKRENGLSLATRAVHADANVDNHSAVAPALHTSTTYRFADDPDELVPFKDLDPERALGSHAYARYASPNMVRFEAVLISILGGPALTYSSGLAAFHAILVLLNPRRFAIGEGYHGCHGIIKMVSRMTGLETLPLDCDASELQPGDIIHVETPLNTTGEAINLQHYADKAHKAGAFLTVDATFGPPPLQNPFDFGADIVLHSGTKYFGGHSDMLCGILAVNPKHDFLLKLHSDRVYLGSVAGNMESWLGMRSLRTLELRLQDSSAAVHRVVEQMPNGYGPVFSITLKDATLAKRLPSKLRLFQHATSLGGVESLIEWRAMTNTSIDQRLVRLSVGVEALEDLTWDLQQGLEALSKKTLPEK